jgi:hypothetical protein
MGTGFDAPDEYAGEKRGELEMAIYKRHAFGKH